MTQPCLTYSPASAGRAPRARDVELIERAAELDALRATVADAVAGRGTLVVLEAPAGLGKTTLLERAAALAGEAGCAVRSATPGPLERGFGYGVLRALLEAPVRDAGGPLDGPAGVASRLLLEGGAPAGDETALIAHSAFWLASALAAEQPLVLLVDDAHWADRASLEVLTYVARRIAELPVVLVVASRDDDPEAPSDLLALLAGTRNATVLRPQPLTVWGAAALIRRHAPDTSLRTSRECHRAVGGTPWLLAELGRRLADGRRGGPVSSEARDCVRRRLAPLKPRDRAAAAALAVLGHAAPPHVRAALAGVAIGELAPARDALRSAGLVSGDRFAHGLVARAVLDDLPGTERERLHRDAARLLSSAGAVSGLVAGHLLACEPHGDPDVTGMLLRAAADAAPRDAVAYLERALKERADGDDRAAIRARLATAAFDAELPDARRRLYDALPGLPDRTGILTRLAGLQALAGGDDSLAERLDAEAAQAQDAGARLAIEVAALDVLAPRDAARRVAAMDAPAEPVLARAVDAHRAWAKLDEPGATAEACAALARSALRDGLLLRDAGRRLGYHLAVRTLIAADRHVEARTAIDALRAAGSDRLRAAAAVHAGELALRTGDVAGAEREARAALELTGDLGPVASGARVALAGALTERGEYDEAATLLRAPGLDSAAARHAQARLWLATGEYERGYAEAVEAGARCARDGHLNPARLPWRTTAALALAHLGRRREAAALADEDVARTTRFRAPVALLTALHARAVAEADESERVALCRRALGLAGGVNAVLHTVRLRLELGSTLSRLGSRVEARDALRPALAAADEAGAMPLAERARRELVATGLRPRRAAIEGAAALTPRQRQICTLAAAGKRNREIGHALFLSVKTVETHLASAYRKLGISSRDDLELALAGA